jgi:outer membrane protein TolC
VRLRGEGGGAGPLAALAGALLLGACKQGPNFFSPAPPEEKAYTPPTTRSRRPTAPGVKSRAAQRIAFGAKVKDDWWTLFHSPPLDRVMREALAGSPTIAQAPRRSRRGAS